MSLKLRIALYSLTIIFGFFQTAVCAAYVTLNGFAPLMPIFQGMGIGWSLATWIWASVLLSYNNRPLSTHPLTRSLAHFTSFTILAVGWFALFIMLGTQFPLQCDFHTPSDGWAGFWCSGGTSSFGIAVLLWSFCSISAIIICREMRKLGDLSVNIAKCGAANLNNGGS